MPKGFCLSIGVNSFDPGHYLGETGELPSCENDAKDVAAITTAAGIETKVLLTQDATSTAVLKTLLEQSGSLSSSDLMVMYYSGHGGQVLNVSTDEPGEDRYDETMCLFDRMLIDDELFAMWAKFKPGTRIFMLADSCHSGSIAKEAGKKNHYSTVPNAILSRAGYAPGEKPIFKTIEFTLSWRTYTKHKTMYDSLGYVAANAEVKASVVQISACQDEELAAAGSVNSLFTSFLKDVWAKGAYPHGHRRFCSDIAAMTEGLQRPNYLPFGTPNPTFEAQKPFTI